ncbi:MAG TPA: Mur ligase domain-containing protein, partial [Chondromyces sp.]|nr:Mur ligase domain-containing protein [Chondromyces sp.]
MELNILLESLPLHTISSDQNPIVTSIENDHRKVAEGSLFICIKGYTFDGHLVAKEAAEKGAVAIVAERPVEVENVPVILVPDTKRAMAVLADAYYGSPTKEMRLVGVTGTNGKTTTSHLVEEIFKHAGEKTG